MNLFRPFRESPEAADFDRDEKRFNDAAEFVDAVVGRGTLLVGAGTATNDCASKEPSSHKFQPASRAA